MDRFVGADGRAKEVSLDNPLPVTVTSGTTPGGGSGDASAANQVLQLAELKSIAGLQVPAHDHITGIPDLQTPTQIVYRIGGAGGTVVGTLNLTYSGGKLVSVARV